MFQNDPRRQIDPGPGYREFHGDTSDDESDPDVAPTHQVLPNITQRKNRWHHIHDLDSFFTRVYEFHQQHGLLCMFLQSAFDISQYVFIIWFTTELRHCVDYDMLFSNGNFTEERSLLDGFKSRSECHSAIRGDGLWCLFLIFASVFGAIKAFKLGNRILQFMDIKNFYHEALGISSERLDHLSWIQIQSKLLEAQKLNQMCIHKEELSELDVHNRILRYKNYMLALVHKNILPLEHRVPFLGDVIFFSEGLKFNIEWILFGSYLTNPWAPFSSFQLKPQYKRSSCRQELSADLSKRIFFCGLVNFMLMPVIFCWTFIFTFFNYFGIIRREPGMLSLRKWSLYGCHSLRHYNELSHQFKERISRAIKPSNRYLESFLSYPLIEIAKFASFICSAILGVFLILGIIDDDFLRMEHALSAITVLGIVLGVTLSLIPDDFFVPLHAELLQIIADHVHYVPQEWLKDPRSAKTQKFFSQLYQMKLSYIIEELLSPIVTPFILIFKLRYRSAEIVDFLRTSTVDVQGVGDVCSLAQLDLKMASQTSDETNFDRSVRPSSPKTELSLLNFSVRHPNWQPASNEAQQLLDRIKSKTREMFPNGQTTSQNQSLRPDLMSSLSPLGVSLLSPQAPSMLPTLLENSVQSFTNETQHLMAVSMAAYHEIEKRENQRLFSSVPNQTTDVMDIDIESTKMVKSTN